MVPAFALVVAALLVRLGGHRRAVFAQPRGLWVLIGLAGWTLLTLVPLPIGLATTIAPRLADLHVAARAGLDANAAFPLSATPGDTALEAVRLFALAGLFLGAAQLPWRTTAWAVVIAGTAVSLVGFLHSVTDQQSIYGMYRMIEADPARRTGLLTSFVNTNHQAALLLLGSIVGVAVAADERRAADASGSYERARRHEDRSLLAVAATGAQVVALMLSLSRGALLLGILALPAAGLLALRIRQPREGPGRARRGRLVLLGVCVVIVGLVALLGPARELESLGSTDAIRVKLDSTLQAATLVQLSPALGIGPGAFADLSRSAVDVDGLYFRHVESAPIAWLVCWGPLVAATLVLYASWWWVAAWRFTSDAGPRIVLVALACFGLQNLVDFNWQYLGVSAAATALAGSTAPHAARRWKASTLRLAAPAAVAATAVVGLWVLPATWLYSRELGPTMPEARMDPASMVDVRPFDRGVQLHLARGEATREDWTAARARAEFLTVLGPTDVDAWLLLAASERALGDERTADEATRAALMHLRRPLPPGPARWLLNEYGVERLHRVSPQDTVAWRHLADGLLAIEPEAADELARLRELEERISFDALLVRSESARARELPELALAYARLAEGVDRGRREPYAHQARVLSAMGRPMDAADSLERGLSNARVGRDALQEMLVVQLIVIGDPAAFERADELIAELLNAGGNPQTRARRRDLARALAEARR